MLSRPLRERSGNNVIAEPLFHAVPSDRVDWLREHSRNGEGGDSVDRICLENRIGATHDDRRQNSRVLEHGSSCCRSFRRSPVTSNAQGAVLRRGRQRRRSLALDQVACSGNRSSRFHLAPLSRAGPVNTFELMVSARSTARHKVAAAADNRSVYVSRLATVAPVQVAHRRRI